MKIISKFQDYYDIGIAYGVDEKLRFERVSKEMPTIVQELRSIIKVVYRKQSQYYRILCSFNVTLFCDKAYPLVYISVEKIKKVNKKFTYELADNTYCYDLNGVDEYISEHYKPLDEIKDDYERLGYSCWNRNTLKKYVKEHFTQDFAQSLSLFDVYKKPYFYLESIRRVDEKGFEHTETKTILLAQLKQYKFAKAVPPMQAFQEISMYLGKLDLTEDNMVTIDDKYLALGKGFDCYSFKKIPKKREKKIC